MSLKNIFSFGWNNNNDSNSSLILPTRSRKRKQKQNNIENKENERQNININDFRRGNKQRNKNNNVEVDSNSYHPFVIGLAMDAKIKKSVEQEQNTRKLTLEREQKKQSQLQKLKEEKRCFDIAILVNKNNEYYKILSGPITYEVFYNYLRFHECENYIANDIKYINKSCEFIEELSGKDIFEYFCNYAIDNKSLENHGVPFRFNDISKIQLFRFNENTKNIWIQHKNRKQNIECDILIIANHQNIPKYVLYDVGIDLIDQQIQFNSYNTYETGDYGLLNKLGCDKLLDFEITKTSVFYKAEHNKLFAHNFGISNNIYNSFAFGICYNFNNLENKNIFFNQNFDIGLITNKNDELLYLLNNVLYDVKNESISYKECQKYRNGDYQKLKQCGDEIKYIKIKQIKQIKENKNFDFDFTNGKKCILYNLTNKELWLAYIGKQKTAQYDIASITDINNYICYILKNVTVNWINSDIIFEECQEYNEIHNQQIKSYGQLILSNPISEFSIHNRSQFDENNTYNAIFFYKLNNIQTSPTEINEITPETPATPQLTEEKSIIYNNPYSNTISNNRSISTSFSINNYKNDLHTRKETQTFEMPVRQSTIFTNDIDNDITTNDLDMKRSSSYSTTSNVNTTSHYKTNTTINLTERDSIMPDRMSVLQSMGNVTKVRQQIMQSQNNNINKNKNKNKNKINTTKRKQSTIHVDDELITVWNAYIGQYGFEPSNPQQLKVFSAIQHNIKSLSYSKARNLYKHMKGLH